MIGKVAKCKRGIVGVVAFTRRMGGGGEIVYHGVSLNGKKWQSVAPDVIANSVEEYYKNRE